MSSTKALLCDLCVILLLGLAVAGGLPPELKSLRHREHCKGICMCGGFPSTVIETDSQPLLSQSPGLEVQCDDEGENTCKQLCIALATAAKAKGPEVLCVRLINAEDLKLSAFSKICDRPWMYADMTADEPLCCASSKVKPCGLLAENANVTDVTDTKTVL